MAVWYSSAMGARLVDAGCHEIPRSRAGAKPASPRPSTTVTAVYGVLLEEMTANAAVEDIPSTVAPRKSVRILDGVGARDGIHPPAINGYFSHGYVFYWLLVERSDVLCFSYWVGIPTEKVD